VDIKQNDETAERHSMPASTRTYSGTCYYRIVLVVDRLYVGPELDPRLRPH